MSHFFVNLDKPLYSFKNHRLSPVCWISKRVEHWSPSSHVYTLLVLQLVAKAVKRNYIYRRCWENIELERNECRRPPEEVGVDVGEAVVLGQGEEDTRRAAAVPLAAEAAVADATAGGTLPLLERDKITHTSLLKGQNSHLIECVMGFLRIKTQSTAFVQI